MELFEEVQSGCGAEVYQPLIRYLLAQREGRVVSPYIPEWSLMPLPKLCKLALLWAEGGWKQEAGHLAHWLLPFQSFLPLWCPEKEYNREEGEYWFSRLSQIPPIAGERPPFPYSLTHTSRMSSVFTLAGKGTSLGMIRAGNVEIRAMGPQSASLDFGIEGEGMDGWTRCFRKPEIWLELKTECQEARCLMEVRFVGLTPEVPLSFAFYVKAERAEIEGVVFKPKSLRRFQGKVKSLRFQEITIESSTPHRVQLIPLAGEGCFWDCEFLANFEIHPLEPRVCFSIHS